MENRIFFPQTALDEWIVDGTVELQDGELTILSVGRRYRVSEAVRVLRDVTGGGDAELVGRVKTRTHLEGLGAEIVETSMLLGDTAYDVEPGWVGVPSTPFADFMAVAKKPPSGTKTDEELLARFLSRA
jgi:hypothetical protein